jgi:hypothetical protein
VQAIVALHREKRFADGVSYWFKQAQIHAVTHGLAHHHTAGFLIWHRKLLQSFEEMLREVNPEVTIPYWDWSQHPQRLPTASGATLDLFTSNFMGNANGRVGAPFEDFDANGSDVESREALDSDASGRFLRPPTLITRDLKAQTFREFVANLPLRHALDQPRKGGIPAIDAADPRAPTVHEIEAYTDDQSLIAGSDSLPMLRQWPRFAARLEYLHEFGHEYVGGTFLPLNSSFNDPFVFLFHANVDRIWASWQLHSFSGIDHRRWSWRLEPSKTYGNDTVDASRPLEPWARRSQFGEPINPWAPPESREHTVHGLSQEVASPPLYDRYVTDEICFSWNALFQGLRLPDRDVIKASVEYAAPGVDSEEIEFVLTVSPEVFWYKAIRVPIDGGRSHREISTENSRKVARVSVERIEVWGRKVEFHKALSFLRGVQKVYELDVDWVPSGSRVTFYWEDD